MNLMNAVLFALMGVVMGSAQAGMVDARTSTNTVEIEAIYKSALVEDVALGIVPPNYTVQYQNNTHRKLRTSLEGRGHWNELLDRALTPAGLKAALNQGTGVVTISSAAPAPSTGAASSSASAEGGEAQWTIRSGELLSEAFNRWAQSSGKWKLVWDASDLVAQADLSMNGKFEDVVAKVLTSLNRSGAGLQAKFYATNYVLRVMEKQ